MLRLPVTFAVFIIAASCSSKQVKQPPVLDNKTVVVAQLKENLPVDTVIRSIPCKTAPAQSFSLYLPPSYSSNVPFPVLMFFDPHGDGSLPVSKYHLLARKFGYVLIGSNNARNGLTPDQTNNIAATLTQDLRTRIAADEKRITLAGFSGGAKVALAYTYSHPEVQHVIYAGAAIPLPLSAPPLAMLGFAGINDMNYTDLLAFDQSIKKTAISHLLIEWNGKHEWPDTAAFRDAFYWLSFEAMRSSQEFDESLLQTFSEAIAKKIAATSEPVSKAMQLNKAIFFLQGITATDRYQVQLDALMADNAFQAALQQKQQALQTESRLKQNYYAAFQDKDLQWWKNEIARMKQMTDPSTTAMYQRLLGFISLACYSISGNAIAQSQWSTAEKMLAIYKLADPMNADQPFFEACYFARLGENKNALISLNRAVDLGLKDPDKILHEPALLSLQNEPGFISLVAKLQQQTISSHR
ncbi:MAG: hypothetical protein K1X61_05065 [Chitinophagales bacterium]|nr:hypothetical protein [Chitinophagales bacterium]